MNLLDFLNNKNKGKGFSLAMAPGFFRKFAYSGALQAIEEANVLKILSVGGSSAGAIVSGFLACEQKPSEFSKELYQLEREEFWDVTYSPLILFGLLKGKKMENLFESKLKYQTFEECNIKMGVTAYDLFRCKTRLIQDGRLAQAMAASCTVPVMFQPLWMHGSPHIDGGLFDSAGMMALPCPYDNKEDKDKDKDEAAESESNQDQECYVVNFLCHRNQLSSSILPESFDNCTTNLLTIIIEEVPAVNPFNMKVSGPIAHGAARVAMTKALESLDSLVEVAPRHYVYYLNCSTTADGNGNGNGNDSSGDGVILSEESKDKNQ